MSVKIGNLTLYSIKDLVEILGVQAITLRRYFRDGRMRGRKIAGKWYVSEKALEEFFLEEDEAVSAKVKSRGE